MRLLLRRGAKLLRKLFCGFVNFSCSTVFVILEIQFVGTFIIGTPECGLV